MATPPKKTSGSLSAGGVKKNPNNLLGEAREQPGAKVKVHNKTFIRGKDNTFLTTNKTPGGKPGVVGKVGTAAILAALKKQAANAGKPGQGGPAKTYTFGDASNLSKDEFDWLSKGADNQYGQEIAGYKRTADDYKANNNLLRDRYNANQRLATKNLGFQNGGWNRNDQTTSYGQDINNQSYDFGARGAMQSGEFYDARRNLQTGYDQQLQGMNLAGEQQNADITHANEQMDLETKGSNTAALKDALARYAASKQKVV